MSLAASDRKMKKRDQSITTRHRCVPTVLNRFFVLLLIFCFAGFATGSCTSYGHSCWGAHGKRSYNNPRVSQHRQIDASQNGRSVSEVETDGNPATTNNQNNWFLSRLIRGRLAVPAAASIVGERPGNRWQEEQKILTLPEDWNIDYDTTRNEIFRSHQPAEGNEIAENAVSIEDSKELEDPLDLTRKVTKSHDGTTEFLFVPSRNAYDKHHPSRTRELRLYKILIDSADDALK